MPVFLPWRKPNDVAWPNFFNWSTIALCPTASGSNYQRLSKRMRVPSRARAWLKRNACASGPSRSGRLKEWVDANCSREPVGRTFAGGLRTSAFDVHRSTPLPAQVCDI